MKLFAILLAVTASSAYARGNVYYDAGSSGTKRAAYSKDDNSEMIGKITKFLSTCTATGTDIPSPLLGNSAFGVVGTPSAVIPECRSVTTSIGSANTPVQPANALEYGKFLADQAYAINSAASNKGAIPTLATAGNRIISRAMNNKIWGTTAQPGVCDAASDAHPAYKIASLASGKCGTIPGTKEAVFEATAFHSVHKDSHFYKPSRRLIFTSGGASAQISLPIYTVEDEDTFNAAVERVNAKFKQAGCTKAGLCSHIKTPGNNDLPFFTTDKDHTHAFKNAAADFIRYWSKSELESLIYKGAAHLARNRPFQLLTGDPNFRGLATISFIGLAGKGGAHYKGVAGGANLIEEWAKVNDCALKTWDSHKKPAPGWVGGDSNPIWDAIRFQGCLEKFRDHLKQDILWTTASELMTALNLRDYRISYGTASLQPYELVKEQDGPPGFLAPKETKEIMTEDALKHLHSHIHNDKHLFGKGDSGSPLNEGVDIVNMQTGLRAILKLAESACQYGRGFGHGYTTTCAKAIWFHEFLALGLSSQNVADFGDADVGKGEIFSFKAKRNLRKTEKQQATLKADAAANAQMLAHGKKLLQRISGNPLNYMDGVAYAA